MPQVSPLSFTEALHVACVNTCICRAPVGWYVECIAIVLQNFVNTTEYQGFISSRGAYLSREYQSKGWTRKYIQWNLH